MNTRRGTARQGPSVWTLLVPLWVYAALIGVLAASVNRLLASNEVLQWTATAALITIGGGSFPSLFRGLQRVTRSRH